MDVPKLTAGALLLTDAPPRGFVRLYDPGPGPLSARNIYGGSGWSLQLCTLGPCASAQGGCHRFSPPWPAVEPTRTNDLQKLLDALIRRLQREAG